MPYRKNPIAAALDPGEKCDRILKRCYVADYGHFTDATKISVALDGSRFQTESFNTLLGGRPGGTGTFKVMWAPPQCFV